MCVFVFVFVFERPLLSSRGWEVSLVLYPSTAEDSVAQFVRLTLTLTLDQQVTVTANHSVSVIKVIERRSHKSAEPDSVSALSCLPSREEDERSQVEAHLQQHLLMLLGSCGSRIFPTSMLLWQQTAREIGCFSVHMLSHNALQC